MYIIVEKNTGRYIRDTGVANNIDVVGQYNTLHENIDEVNEQIVYVEDDSPFVDVFHSLLDKEFAVELINNEVVGVRVL